MRKLIVFLLFSVAGLQAQEMSRLTDASIEAVDSEAPIGLDLMGGNKEGVTVYPNADNDHILISVAGKRSERKSISISDFSGRIVLQTPKSAENTYLVDVSGLKKDFYIVEVYSGGKVYRKKWLRS
ncbi:T9SS type A sorting domain-containing protein [Flavobacterium sp. CYK-4]|uniref:T9SS type A sorting domain-containing protein n=1 Tax=Flavobacterium lotistagni TaxID=2709660 RepID=UPI00140CE9E6|nr:T9SS type A sorting domain-containing protein [Flavobacterium lotistagni]NHM06203.1 T9SS type A sorting domain-containing protein [Flavobacterium lotistagni]